MKVRQWIIAIVLLLLVAGATVGLLWTRPQTDTAESEDTSKASGARKFLSHNSSSQELPLVDQRPLQTARRMAQLASSQEGLRFAHEAEKVGDHEVDLAFADALRTAAENPPKLTPDMKVMLDRKTKAGAAVKTDQDTIDQATKRLATAPESQKDNLQDQIAVAKGQLELDQDEFEDASEDLARAGGDPQAKIQRLLEEHEAGHSEAQNQNPAPEPDYEAHTLYAAFRAWRELRARIVQLEAAREETTEKQQRLSVRHQAFEKHVEEEKPDRENAKQQAAGFSQSNKTVSSEDSKAAARATLDTLKHYTEDQRTLADLGKRIQDEQELSDIYSNWIALVASRERAALHNMIQAVLWILVVVLLVYLAGRVVDRLFSGFAPENTRVGTLRTVVHFALQALGAIAILFIILGLPSQTTTVLGLAGAGLTVAMKDFIVAFFGWFVLMGKNGIRVGDWVEINGVGGEVVEVGLLKTVVLETGNWTDVGHPTGRKVSFVNSFAIEGHFFNFTTSGQWMWDELQFSIPGNQDPYAFIDDLQKLVGKETEANAKKAELEWQSTTAHYKVKGFSAEPAINVRPTGSGVEVRIRYITRASERHETRKRLYEAVVQLMHGKREAVGTQQP
jgi:small-conductance mechanosensitive channel